MTKDVVREGGDRENFHYRFLGMKLEGWKFGLNLANLPPIQDISIWKEGESRKERKGSETNLRNIIKQFSNSKWNNTRFIIISNHSMSFTWSSLSVPITTSHQRTNQYTYTNRREQGTGREWTHAKTVPLKPSIAALTTGRILVSYKSEVGKGERCNASNFSIYI